LIKPKRHVVHVWELTAEEAREFGPLLRRTAQIAAELTPCEQVYTTQWSHAGGGPGHLHWVIQPVTRDQTLMFGLGPGLQQAMFVEGSLPTVEVVDAIADRARLMFATSDELS
jgi:ATP adenylyltransferase